MTLNKSQDSRILKLAGTFEITQFNLPFTEEGTEAKGEEGLAQAFIRISISSCITRYIPKEHTLIISRFVLVRSLGLA